MLFFKHFPGKLGWKSDKTDSVQYDPPQQEETNVGYTEDDNKCKATFASINVLETTRKRSSSFGHTGSSAAAASSVIIPLVKFHCLW